MNDTALPLVLISNHLKLIQEADACKISRIMLDLETTGKASRQKEKKLFIANHSLNNIVEVKNTLSFAKCMVRINSLNSKSKQEIEGVINNGADIIMLPFFTHATQVQTFIDHVSGRCRVSILLETKEALENIDSIVSVPGIDEIHVGLNDLCLSLGNASIFDVITDGTLERLQHIIVEHGIQFGFGGVAPPRAAEYPVSPHLIIAEQMRLNSRLAILSRRASASLEDGEYPYSLKQILQDIEVCAHAWGKAGKTEQEAARNTLIGEINRTKEAVL